MLADPTLPWPPLTSHGQLSWDRSWTTAKANSFDCKMPPKQAFGIWSMLEDQARHRDVLYNRTFVFRQPYCVLLNDIWREEGCHSELLCPHRCPLSVANWRDSLHSLIRIRKQSCLSEASLLPSLISSKLASFSFLYNFCGELIDRQPASFHWSVVKFAPSLADRLLWSLINW